MRDERFFARSMVAVFFSFAVPLFPQSQVTIGEIKNSIICLCDCNMTVEACEGSMACQSAANLTAEARGLIDQGLGKKEVLASFVASYGERVLAAPTKRGFNLTAWVLPFAAIIAAGFGIIMALRRWAKPFTANRGRSFPQNIEPEDPAYERKLEEVLHSLD